MFESRRSSLHRRAAAFATLLVACLAVLAPAPSAAAAAWIWPLDGDVITPYRNGSDPYAAGQHRGIDIASPAGATVRSVAAGEVTFAGRLPDSGNCVTVAAGRHLVSYLHLQSIAVRRGARLGAGAAIGRVGTTGNRSASAPHLHLGVRLASDGAYLDPLPLLGPRPVTQPPAEQHKGAAQPQAAQPPAAQRPAEQQRPAEGRRPNGRAKGESRARDGRRGESNGRSQSRARRGDRARSRLSRPRTTAGQVHAPLPGDTVVAAPVHAALGSAREGHASRGRVAPPPIPRPGAVRLTGGSVGGQDAHGETAVAAPAAVKTARSAGGAPWPAPALVAICLAATLLLWRSRGPGRGAGPGEGPGLVIERPSPATETAPAPRAPDLRVVSR